jgi:hypothetical protein
MARRAQRSACRRDAEAIGMSGVGRAGARLESGFVAAALAWALLGGATLAESSGAAAWAAEEEKKVDPCDVYFGDAAKWAKAAEVDADKVYAKISEYKEIVDSGLKPGDAKYEILMSKASKRFCAAVKKTAKDGGYDLVARKDRIKGCGKVPEITDDVISNL